jgi:hypothetical protein
MENATIIVGEDTKKYALLAAIKALRLWSCGIKVKGCTPGRIARQFGVKSGSAMTVLAQLEALK